MKPVRLLWAAIPLVALTGCIQSHRAVVYTPEPVLAPTSSRPEVRVYRTPAPNEPTPPTTPPAAPQDISVATSVAQLLKGDAHLASLTGNVEASVDNQIVTLRGTVPSEGARDEIVQRVSQLPGVLRVRDQLGIDIR